MHIIFSCGDMTEREHLGELGVDRWIILKWIFQESDEKYGLDLSGLG